MKATKGRLNTFPFIFKYYLKDNIMVSLTGEKISIFSDGTIKRTRVVSRVSGYRRTK